jgi:hypothetical protein
MIEGSRQRPRVRLEPGSHRSPDDGVCIVELASMIGGEPFSDRPDCVCPVIGSFLRGWNDRAGYADRQRLHPYASRVVGTGGFRRISRIRRDRCLAWSGADLARGPVRRLAERLWMRAKIAWIVGLWPAIRLNEGAGTYAARVSFARGGSEEAFALLDRLLEVGPRPETEPSLPARWVPADVEVLAEQNGNGNGNGHRRGDLGIRATIAARERAKPSAPRSRAARESG